MFKANFSCDLLAQLNYHQVRIIKYNTDKWFIDPLLDKVKPSWRLWVYGKRPLVRLLRDLGEYMWNDPFTHKQVGFFF